jgi:UDP-glucose 4-epimerase
VVGTLRLLELCREQGVRKVVFASSGGTVYGVPRSVPIDESHPTEPICSYGIHKLMIEKYLQLNHRVHGLDYCVVRPPNLYGRASASTSRRARLRCFSIEPCAASRSRCGATAR